MLLRLSVLMLAGLASFAQVSQELEARINASAAESVRRCTTPFDSQNVRDYITRLGSNLAAQLPDRGLNLTFEIVTDSLGESTNLTHEPLFLPGGYIFVPASLIIEAQSEAELAGLLAHAIAHATDPQMAGKDPRVHLINNRGWCGMGALPGAFVETQRTSELQADQLALSALERTGYNARALIHYVSRQHPSEAGQRDRFFWLPPRSERLAALEAAVTAFPTGVDSSSDDFQLIQQEVRSLLPVRHTPALRRASE